METAKAGVEGPAPVSGKVLKLAGNAGDVITTGALLAEFEIDASKPQRAEGHDTGHHHAAKPAAKAADAAEATAESKPEAASESSPEDNGDDGTEVGAMESSERVHTDRKSTRLNSSH